ncbi:SMI1/KNR4 family protein [Nocardia sp. NPDC127579]|uniref:SMI1/KNR4 family protein n=1 Tax=Nocardia sp. NPDC127579 TaxID=3345402 RepID=UPI0036409BC0
MDREQLMAAVFHLMEVESGALTCDQPGHAGGHTCVSVSDDGVAVDDAFDSRYVKAYWRGEPPMAVPDEHDWDQAWVHGMRAVLDGQDAEGRLVVAVAQRTIPEPVEPPEELSWVQRLVAITDGPSSPVPQPDWAAVEARLGTPLPTDYKQLVEAFGCAGRFNGFFDVFDTGELIWHTEYYAGDDLMPGEEYPAFPARGGLIPWSKNEHEQTYFWITEGSDPGRWPVYAVDSLDEGTRFDCTATEFLYRQMTDPHHPFHIAAENARGHWFEDLPR